MEIRKNDVISTNPCVYWRRVSRTTLYALSSHFIIYKFFSYKHISFTCVLRSRYGNTVVKDIRKFEKIDFALRKCKLDLLFLETFLENQIIPKFRNFRVSNLHLKTSRAYHACQLKLLPEEISFKRSRIKTSENDFNTRKRKLRGILGIIDYTHVCCLFLNKNDKKRKTNKIFTLNFLM